MTNVQGIRKNFKKTVGT